MPCFGNGGSRFCGEYNFPGVYYFCLNRFFKGWELCYT